MKSTLLLVCTASALAACSSFQYEIPAGSPRATLTLRNAAGPGRVSTTTHQKPDCADAGKAVPHEAIAPGGEATVQVEAGKPLVFAIQTLRPLFAGVDAAIVNNTGAVNTCHVAGTFVPAPNGRYIALVTDDTKTCHVEVRDASSNTVAAGFEERKWFYPTMTKGWHCGSGS